jgi:alkylation response protein AidB-like acyl-CoA dehydrogenase
MSLDLPFTADQLLLRDSLRRFLVDHPRPDWADMSDALGLDGLAAPVEAGGFGGGPMEIAIVAAELGPALAGGDWVPHAVATWLIGRLAPGHAGLAGRSRVALICPASAAAMPMVDADRAARGTAALVAGGAAADLLLLVDAGAVLLFSADGPKVERHRRVMRDGSAAADIGFAPDGAHGELLATGAEAGEAAETVQAMMLTARCAEAVGLMHRMMADSVEHLEHRKQFGRPIGDFQVLRHRLADMRIALMKAAALTEAAIAAVESRAASRGRTVSGACVEVADAVRIVGESAVQLHGAMGLTEELRLGGHFKRALAIAAGLGPQADLLTRFAEAEG